MKCFAQFWLNRSLSCYIRWSWAFQIGQVSFCELVLHNNPFTLICWFCLVYGLTVLVVALFSIAIFSTVLNSPWRLGNKQMNNVISLRTIETFQNRTIKFCHVKKQNAVTSSHLPASTWKLKMQPRWQEIACKRLYKSANVLKFCMWQSNVNATEPAVTIVSTRNHQRQQIRYLDCITFKAGWLDWSV